MVSHFAGVPPEITSALMYSGAGAGPLMAAATAYANLAAELSTSATQWESIISFLTTEQWTGAGSTAAAAAAQPIVSWLTTSAAALEHASTQAMASAAAYETAFAATVPPPMIAANRAAYAAALGGLPFTAPLVAELEAQYVEMWVQDATMMSTYQAASAAAGTLHPVAPMTPATNPVGPELQAASLVQANAATPTQTLTNALGGIIPGYTTPPVPATGLNFLQSIDGFLGTPSLFNGVNGVVNTAAWFTMNGIPTAVSFGHTVGAVPSIPWTADAVAPAPGAAAITEGTMVRSFAPAGLGAAASASMGEASAVGGLSVPAGWSAAAPASLASSTAPLEGSGWTVASEEPVAAMPGMPGTAAAAKGAAAYGSGPRYGFKPIVMPKQVVV